jgi:hypothetical protein
MDEAGRSVAGFLESLQDAMRQMDAVREHYQRRGTRPGQPHLVLSGRPFRVHENSAVREFNGCVSLGLIVRGADDREFDLGVSVMWDSELWTLTTEAWVESDRNQDLLRALPERTASDPDTCRGQLTAAITDLLHFVDLVPGRSSAT